jgi:tol-pal system protein YbgF
MKRWIPLFMACALICFPCSSRAGVKEELMRLQSDVLAMQNQIRLLEKTFKEQTDGLRTLVAQLNDQAGQSNLLLGKISTILENQAAGDKSSNQTLLQELRNLSTKMDDSSTRVSALAQQIAEMKVQSKPITQRLYQAAPTDPAGLAMSSDAIYNEAFNDLVQGNLDFAIEGFSSFVKNFPSNEKADDALYNIGEAYYNGGKIPQAVTAFTRVIEEYSSGNKVPSAYFKRAKGELKLQERENAIADFRLVIEKYPEAPESLLAKSELETLGVPLSKPAAKPASKSAPSKRRP